MSRRLGRVWPGLLAALALAACTIEVGPPPESDPPVVSEAASAPLPPQQPTEPQAWSRGLDFDSAPVAADREALAEGLVPADEPVRYSGQQLTYQSAFDPEKPPSEAELALQRAQERAARAGLPAPPQVVAAPVAEVDSQALPPAGADQQAQAQAPRRESRLPPPPTFPPVAEEWQETAAVPNPAVAETDEQPEAQQAPEPWSARNSRLPAPPTFPPAPAPQAERPEGEDAAKTVAAADAAQAPLAGEEEGEGAASFAMAAWDAPTGTILVQVSAVSDGGKVAQEWERLQARYPQVLKPLRLVVDEAELGGRGVFYRVQAGAFTSQAGAAAACDDLISQGQACFVVVR